MEQQIGSKLGNGYLKAAFCYPAYLTYMQSTLWETLGWMRHKLESRLLGEISITSDMQMRVKWPSCVRLFVTPWTIRLPGSSVHGIFQARVLEWVAISFSRVSPGPKDRTWVSLIVGRCFTVWATREVRYAHDTTLMAESKDELKSLLMKRGERKSWLKAQHSENEDNGIRSHHFMGNRWGNSGDSVRLYFLGLQNQCRWWLQPWN